MIIIKIGGGEAINLSGIVRDISTISGPVLIVHGANTLRDRVAERMGYETQVLTSVSGYTSVFSDQNAIDAILMAYSGLRNKRIVELCQQHGINAVGLTGLDGRIVQGRRNRGIRVVENGKKMIRRDFSGKPATVNTGLLETLLSNGYTPVLTIPIMDEEGNAINSENDDIVCELQSALGADIVIQLIEAPGFMDEIDNPDSLVPTLSENELEAREEVASGRIRRKLRALLKLCRSGGCRIIIADGRTDSPVSDALSGAGTVIRHS
ncbi:MAG: [LysW]-aminoadipate kinase [Gammaproteobacteria bacterium]|nr:[LysW]-aminoadipate kinase [Gammaproteobacteria bacterium]MYD75510.1 [LysW]-aminoadipate kinase [Gammaproteobacteria bacterium]MYJ52381.1 [LysW]-aminoadipate kinase [Gammaproteobacteria bacterium]